MCVLILHDMDICTEFNLSLEICQDHDSAKVLKPEFSLLKSCICLFNSACHAASVSSIKVQLQSVCLTFSSAGSNNYHEDLSAAVATAAAVLR